MPSDPLSDIENEKSQFDTGVFAHRIYRGARSDGASRRTAFLILMTWFKAMFLQDGTALDEDGEDNG